MPKYKFVSGFETYCLAIIKHKLKVILLAT